jgi:hypothetical protein
MTFKQIISQYMRLTRKKYTYIDVFNFCTSAFLIFVFETLYRTEQRIGQDLASYVLPSFAMDNNLGSPYSDYFINRPPGAFISIQLWAKMFGYEFQSWVILESILLLGISLLLYDIFSSLIPKFASAIAAFFALFILLFGGTLAMFMPLEIIGVFIILLATRILVKKSSSFKSNTIFSTLLVFAASIREQYFIVFVFMLVAVLISQVNVRKLTNTILACLLGIILAGLVFLWHFLVNANFISFISVFKDGFNNEKRPVSNYFGWLIDAISFHSVASFLSPIFKPQLHIYTFSIVFSFLLFSVLLYLRNRKLNSHLFQPFIVGMAGFSIIASVSWQSSGFRFSSHYAISSLLGIFLCIVSAISFLTRFLRSKQFLRKRFMHIPILLIFLLAPSFETIRIFTATFNNISVSGIATQFSRITSRQPSLNELKAVEIIRLSPPDFQCTVNVYGWDSGSFYLYSKSKPCTKYFLPNLVVSDQMAIEYRKDIEQNPPRVINYGCLDYLTCSDLDIIEFEIVVFPYAKVISSCYFPVAQVRQKPVNANSYQFFVSRYDTKSDQINCIRTVIGTS